jgi:hypothetical protein
VIGIIGAIGGAVVGAKIGSESNLKIEREQARESRVAEARNMRGSVYLAFLEAASNVVVPAAKLRGLCVEEHCNSIETIERIGGKAFNAFESAYARVQLYGSTKAANDAFHLFWDMPVYPEENGGVGMSAGYSYVQLFGAFERFDRTMCEELNALPRSDCSEVFVPFPYRTPYAKKVRLKGFSLG